jgi:AcrR family transcriptional regulator
MSETGGPRDKLKARMLEVAERILETEGLQAVQARRVAQEADCSVGTLYNVFRGGLDDLIIEANDLTLQKLGSALEAATVSNAAMSSPDGPAALAAPADPRGIEPRLMALALAYLRFAVEHPTPWRAVFEHRLSEKQSVPEWYRESQAALFAIVERVLADVTADEAVRRRAARALFAAVHGIVSLALDRKLGEFDPLETEAQVRLVVGAAARGLPAGLAAA